MQFMVRMALPDATPTWVVPAVQVLWGALFVLAVLVRDADTAGDAMAIDAIASTGMLYVLQRIMADYQVR